jgi:hypothetical protein
VISLKSLTRSAVPARWQYQKTKRSLREARSLDFSAASRPRLTQLRSSTISSCAGKMTREPANTNPKTGEKMEGNSCCQARANNFVAATPSAGKSIEADPPLLVKLAGRPLCCRAQSLHLLAVIASKSSCCSICDQKKATTSGSESFRQADARVRNKRCAGASFDSVGIAIFAGHSTAPTHATMIFAWLRVRGMHGNWRLQWSVVIS